jgi:hypothetical protein
MAEYFPISLSQQLIIALLGVLVNVRHSATWQAGWNTAKNAVSPQSFNDFSYSIDPISNADCGDIDDLTTYNATFMPESDCAMACIGNSSYVCGGPNRISYYNWTGTPLYSWAYPDGTEAGGYEFLVGGVVVPLMTQQNINGKVTFLEKFGTGQLIQTLLNSQLMTYYRCTKYHWSLRDGFGIYKQFYAALASDARENRYLLCRRTLITR